MEEFQVSFSMIQEFMHQWHQVEKEHVAVHDALKDQKSSAQGINEGFQHQVMIQVNFYFF